MGLVAKPTLIIKYRQNPLITTPPHCPWSAELVNSPERAKELAWSHERTTQGKARCESAQLGTTAIQLKGSLGQMKVDTLRHGATVTGRMATAITRCGNETDRMA